MMNSCKLTGLIILSLVETSVSGQSISATGESLGTDQQTYLEERLSQQDHYDAEQIADQWYSMAHSQINLNSDQVEQLVDRKILTEYQVNKIKEYRAIYGDILSPYELLYIDGISRLDVEKMLGITPLRCSITNRFKLQSLFSRPRHFLLFRYQRSFDRKSSSEQHLPGIYFGSPDRFILKYELKLSSHFRMGFTGEKDPGESLTMKRMISQDSLLIPPGFDFYSYYLALEDLGILRTLIIGKYRISFGQGLNLAVGSRMLFSNNYSRISTGSLKITPHFSTDEVSFLQGTCVRLTFKHLSLTGFYSDRKMDANLEEADSGQYSISSFINSGYHRDSSEWAKRSTLRERLAGLISSYRNRFMEISVIGFSQHFSYPVNLGSELYELHYFKGKAQTVIGAETRFFIKNHFILAEISCLPGKGTAFLAGVESHLSPLLSIALYYRNFPERYYNLYGHAYGSHSLSNNERGFYAGLSYQPGSKTHIGFAVDYSRYPWLSYRCDQPSSGLDYRMRVERTIGTGFTIQAGFISSCKSRNSADPAHFSRHTGEQTSRALKFGITIQANDFVKLTSRIDWNNVHEESTGSSRGFMISQDLSYALKKVPVRLYLRWSNFGTDDYESRIYSYEQDVSYALSVPAFQSMGSRYLFMIQATLIKRITFYCRYGLTKYEVPDWPGKADGKGNRQSELKMQAVIRL